MKTTLISLIFAVLVIVGAIIYSGRGYEKPEYQVVNPSENNVKVVDGKQIITIVAKGGYSPKITTAQAGIPTVLKIITKGTFDCSASLSIPSLGYSQILPASGETIVDIPSQKLGEKLQGLCSMGMYNFAINFE